MMRTAVRALLALWTYGISASLAPTWAAEAKPNVVIVLVDDTGYGDYSCHGNPHIKTPEIDKLHGQSIRFTDFHVAPMCTPTRSELMSGRDALDNGAMNVSSGRSMLRRELPTLADAFAASGYRTGIFGKWHLGDVYPYRPQDRGFQTAIWYPCSHMGSVPDYWNNDYFDPHFRLQDGSVKQFKGYCTDVLFGEAMSWMKASEKARQPFFVYLPLNAAHAPLWVPDKYCEPYRSLGPDVASFYGMIANIDENVGRLVKMLQDTGLRDNTILIFMSDNGGTAGVKTFNAGMRGSKITLWEGGHRVPCFIRWPDGRLGSPRDIDELTHIQDLFPTLIDLCDLKAPNDPKFDGTDLTGLLRATKAHLDDRMLVVQFSRMEHQVPVKGDAAVLWKKWRLVNKELYDVAADPGQGHDVAAEHPDVVRKMQGHYDGWWADIEPKVNVLSDLTIGSESEPETLLSASDWQDAFLDSQRQLRKALNRSGPWGLEVARDGDYLFELRRWPREACAALIAPMKRKGTVDGGYPPGDAMPIAKAKLRVGDFEKSQDVKPDDKFVSFVAPLKKGTTKAQTWFYDAAGKEIGGACYVYVHRK